MATRKLRLYLLAGDRPSKPKRVEGEILIFQLIQLCFSRSLGSATSNEANKSTMLRAEWTIATRSAVISKLACTYLYVNMYQNSILKTNSTELPSMLNFRSMS